MPDTPCARCSGSGTEPDAMDIAYRLLTELINGDAPTASLRHAATAYRDACTARITFLAAALRDILSRFNDREHMRGTHQVLQVPNGDVGNWRAILDGTPGIVSADGTQRYVYDKDGAIVRQEDARVRMVDL